MVLDSFDILVVMFAIFDDLLALVARAFHSFLLASASIFSYH